MAIRILFVAEVESVHAAAWMEQTAADPGCDVRVLALPTGRPVPGFALPTEITLPFFRPAEAAHKARPVAAAVSWMVDRLRRRPPTSHAVRRLRQLIAEWHPDIVHVTGLFPAGELYFAAWPRPVGHKLVLEIRGGSDLAFRHADPALAPLIAERLRLADAIISDNEYNRALMTVIGLGEAEMARFHLFIGCGGIDAPAIASLAQAPAGRRNLVLWPKAYESPWSKALPVLEAIRLAWPHLPDGTRFVFLAADPEIVNWIRFLPAGLRNAIDVRGRVSRPEALAEMGKARVMLAPTLIDGTPVSLLEAMAAGAVPVVSPIPTVEAIMEHERSALFARNLYPEEIAEALIRAMTDNALAERIAAFNRERIGPLANMRVVQPRIAALYHDLMASGRTGAPEKR